MGAPARFAASSGARGPAPRTCGCRGTLQAAVRPPLPPLPATTLCASCCAWRLPRPPLPTRPPPLPPPQCLPPPPPHASKLHQWPWSVVPAAAAWVCAPALPSSWRHACHSQARLWRCLRSWGQRRQARRRARPAVRPPLTSTSRPRLRGWAAWMSPAASGPEAATQAAVAVAARSVQRTWRCSMHWRCPRGWAWRGRGRQQLGWLGQAWRARPAAASRWVDDWAG